MSPALFQAWLMTSCPGGLRAQLKGVKLMMVLSTANEFRAAVRALRSLDGGGVEFPLLRAPVGPLCANILGRGMLESAVREKLAALDFHVQGVTQLHSGHREQTPSKDRPLTGPRSIYRWPEGLRCRAITHRTLLLASVGAVVHGSKRPIAIQELPAFSTHAALQWKRALVLGLWGSHRFGG